MAYYSHTATFDKGWTTPLLGSRSDVDFWLSSLSYCLNFNVLTHGGLRRRSGTRFITEVADSSQKTRLLPFKFSEEQSYVLVVNGNKTLRFISERQILYSGTSPYSISHPYAAADLNRLSYAQFNDVAYVAHPKYPPRKILRKSDVNWEVETAVFEDGPYLDLNTSATTLTPDAYGALVPKMSGNTTPSGAVVSVPASTDAYQIFDKDKASFANWGVDVGYVYYKLGAGAAVVDKYYLTANTIGSQVDRTPTAWRIEASNNGEHWITLDSRDSETGWSAGETRFYDFNNKAAFSYYRFSWTGVNGASGNTKFSELGFNRVDHPPFGLTASSLTGINNDAGFLSSDVGRMLRIRGSDGRDRWLRIETVQSATKVTVKMHGHALPDLSPVLAWQLGAWSPDSGYPGSVTLFNERLMFARTNAQPVTVWGTKQGGFDDFGTSDPKVETDGLNITLLSSNQNEVLWLADDEDLVTGSAGQIRSVGPADINKSFSATNITQRKGPTSGAAALPPLSIGGVTLYAGTGATKIRELVRGDQNRYVAPELSLLGEHLFKSGIVDWAFCERPDPQIYCVMGNGSLVSVTYDREQKVVGFAKHEIAGGVVENVAVVSGIEEGFDDVYLCVCRTINGKLKRYIEVLERPFDRDIDTVEDAFHVDCGASYNGVPIKTVTGLGHLEGEQVVALADGSVVSGLTVRNGSVELPYEASKLSIGLPFKSRAVTQPVAGPQQDGTLFGRNRTIISASIDVLNSGAVRTGAAGGEHWTPELYEQLLKTGDTLFGNKTELRTGFVPCDISGSWMEGEGKLVFETSEPLPLLVRSLVLQLESTP